MHTRKCAVDQAVDMAMGEDEHMIAPPFAEGRMTGQFAHPVVDAAVDLYTLLHQPFDMSGMANDDNAGGMVEWMMIYCKLEEINAIHVRKFNVN